MGGTRNLHESTFLIPDLMLTIQSTDVFHAAFSFPLLFLGICFPYILATTVIVLQLAWLIQPGICKEKTAKINDKRRTKFSCWLAASIEAQQLPFLAKKVSFKPFKKCIVLLAKWEFLFSSAASYRARRKRLFWKWCSTIRVSQKGELWSCCHLGRRRWCAS